MSSAPSGFDPFMQFWGEFVKKVSAAGATPPPQPPPDVLLQMRRAFLDAMAQQADQFMRSEAFLNALKQGMEASLAWQQGFNQMMQKGLASAQVPSRADSDHMVVFLRGMEERLLERIDELAARVDSIEKGESPGKRGGRPAGAEKRRSE
jgi:hypothetical protein